MARDSIAAAYAARMPLLQALAERLLGAAEEALDGVPRIDRIAFRVKDGSSFAKKADRYADPLRAVEDQIAGRVLVFFLADIDAVSDRLSELFGPVEAVRKQPEGPTQFGYESDHFVFVIARHHLPDGWEGRDDLPTTFEMQIRTLFQHAWAEPQHDLAYRADGELERDDRRQLAWVAATAWGADRAFDELATRRRRRAPPAQ